MKPITTGLLRASYERGSFSFGNPEAANTVCLIGSCRIVPFLNNLLIYNSLRGNPFNLLCFDPVEMWEGPGHEVSEGVSRVLADYRFGSVDYLVCEHVERCGVLNTVRTSDQNIFDSLGCAPEVVLRLPNWNNMHIFDAETAGYGAAYAALGHDERVAPLRVNTAARKEKFLRYCRDCSFPDLAGWVEDNWLTTRLGWTSNHPTFELVWEMFKHVAGAMGVEIAPELADHPQCCSGICREPLIKLNSVDYEANNWKY